MEVINCKEIAQKIKDNVKEKAKYNVYGMIVLTNPYDEPSKAYVRNKRLAAEYCGIGFKEIPLDENTNLEELLNIQIINLNDQDYKLIKNGNIYPYKTDKYILFKYQGEDVALYQKQNEEYLKPLIMF